MKMDFIDRYNAIVGTIVMVLTALLGFTGMSSPAICWLMSLTG